MYTPEEVAAAKRKIIDEVAGGRSLEALLREDIDLELPSKGTVYAWLQEGHKNFDAVFLDGYAHARALRATQIFEEILEIADTPVDGTTTKYSKANGVEVTTADMLGHRKLQVDARKWVLARMDSKRFGDKLETTLQGGDKPIETIDYGKLSPEALEEIAKQCR